MAGISRSDLIRMQKTRVNRQDIEREDFGFPDTLDFDDFFKLHQRSPLAYAVVHRHADTTFTTNPTVVENLDQHDQTPFEREFEELAERVDLWSKIHAADWRNRVGRYSALYMVFNDGGCATEITKGAELIRLQPLFEAQLTPLSYCDDITDVRYGQPETYMFNPRNTQPDNEGPTSIFTIHHSRVIILAEGSDDDSINGTSALENCYNDIITYDRINGASGRGYWNAARGAITITENNPDEGGLMESLGAESPEDIPDKLESTVKDFFAGFDKALALGNLTATPIQFTLPDPTGFAQSALNSVAASCSCPGPILIGQQLSQRSSDGNENSWLDTIEARRNRFTNPVVRVFVNRMLDYKIIINAPAGGRFDIKWDKLTEDSLGEKLDLATKMSTVNSNAAKVSMTVPFSTSEIREVVGFESIGDEGDAYTIEDETTGEQSDT